MRATAPHQTPGPPLRSFLALRPETAREGPGLFRPSAPARPPQPSPWETGQEPPSEGRVPRARGWSPALGWAPTSHHSSLPTPRWAGRVRRASDSSLSVRPGPPLGGLSAGALGLPWSRRKTGQRKSGQYRPARASREHLSRLVPVVPTELPGDTLMRLPREFCPGNCLHSSGSGFFRPKIQYSFSSQLYPLGAVHQSNPWRSFRNSERVSRTSQICVIYKYPNMTPTSSFRSSVRVSATLH